MDMLRIVARWTGFNGAPGYSNFFFDAGGGLIGDEAQVALRVRSAFFALASRLPTSVRISIDGEAAVVDSESGQVLSFREFEPPPDVTGNDPDGYSGATGAVVNWRTNDLRFGRRIRGRTFLVPLAGGAYQSDGTLTQLALADVREFADVMTSFDLDSAFGVWSRPRNGEGGVFATVTGSNVPDLAAVLRSRRD